MSDRNQQSEFQETVEDALGFNFRSLKTMKDLLIRPKTVFLSYAARDRLTYSPAVRIWLGLIGFQVLFNALFGGMEGLMTRVVESDPNSLEAYQRVSGGRVDEFIPHYAAFFSWTQAPLVGFFSALSVFVLGWFNKSIPFSGRFNIAMGVLTAGSVTGVLTMLMFFIEQPPAWLYLATTGLVVFTYFVTFGRGAKGTLAKTTFGAWSKALVFSLVLISLVMFAYLVITLGAITYAVNMLGPSPVPPT